MTAMRRSAFATGKLNGPAGEKDRVGVGQIGGVAMAKREECAEEDEERERREGREGSPLQAPGLPEDTGVAERAEPEKVNPVGDSGAAADEDEDDCGKKKVDEKTQDGAAWTRIGQLMVSGIFSTPLRRNAR